MARLHRGGGGGQRKNVKHRFENPSGPHSYARIDKNIVNRNDKDEIGLMSHFCGPPGLSGAIFSFEDKTQI